MSTDPHEPPCAPALQRHITWHPHVVRSGGPERIYDADAAATKHVPRPFIGFGDQLDTRGVCPRCGRITARRLDGDLRKHRDGDGKACNP